MRFLPVCIFFIILCSVTNPSQAQQKTEAALIAELYKSLQHKDAKAFGDLFAGIDSLSQWVLQYADKSSESYRKMEAIQGSPYYMLQFDSSISEEIKMNFTDFMDNAKQLSIHWSDALFMRYELEKIRRGRGLISERIAPLRFLGYVFFKDMLTQKAYAFSVYDIMQINGLWYGGELSHIYPANSKEEFQQALMADKRRRQTGQEDPAKVEHATTDDEEDDEEKPSSMKDVVARKLYKGFFDGEVPVQLYVRDIKGSCPEGVCSWEALFKFGDQDEFVKMQVVRSADGRWLFSEEVGGMELKLNGETYTGTYSSSSDKTGYEVELNQVPVSTKKLKSLDEMLEFGIHGK